jgi:hypothetical protein
MEIIYIILGWLFGLLTSPITVRIDRWYKIKDYKFAISSELKNLSVRLTAVSYKINLHQGTMDKSTFTWIKDIYKKHDETMYHPEMEKILELPDEDFKKVMDSRKAQEKISLGFKTVLLPVTDSFLESVFIFDSYFQRKLLELRSQMDLLNQEIEVCMRYFFLTFDPTSMATNKTIIDFNLKNSHSQIKSKCKYVVELSDEIISRC